MSEQMFLPPDVKCPFSRAADVMDKYVVSTKFQGRICTITGVLCWNWNKPAAIENCSVKKEEDRRRQK